MNHQFDHDMPSDKPPSTPISHSVMCQLLYPQPGVSTEEERITESTLQQLERLVLGDIDGGQPDQENVLESIAIMDHSHQSERSNDDSIGSIDRNTCSTDFHNEDCREISNEDDESDEGAIQTGDNTHPPAIGIATDGLDDCGGGQKHHIPSPSAHLPVQPDEGDAACEPAIDQKIESDDQDLHSSHPQHQGASHPHTLLPHLPLTHQQQRDSSSMPTLTQHHGPVSPFPINTSSHHYPTPLPACPQGSSTYLTLESPLVQSFLHIANQTQSQPSACIQDLPNDDLFLLHSLNAHYLIQLTQRERGSTTMPPSQQPQPGRPQQGVSSHLEDTSTTNHHLGQFTVESLL